MLSPSWADDKSDENLGNRIASDTTINAAFLAGIVPTSTNSYSGGVENFPRFLERWTDKTFTYSGSMVVMFPSKFATAAWGGTGDDYGIYDAPNRNWAFDNNFRDIDTLPPGTPMIRALARSTWNSIKPNTTVVSN